MSDVIERYTKAAEGFEQRLRNTAAERWTAASPCEEWTAGQVAAHVVATTGNFLDRLGSGEPRPMAPSDSPQQDQVLDDWVHVRGGVETALSDSDRAGTVISGGMGEQPWEQLIGTVLLADTVVHTWDLAVATGQDERLDPAGVAAATEFLVPMDDMLRRPGGFGAKLDAPGDADDQAKLIAFTGRRRPA